VPASTTSMVSDSLQTDSAVAVESESIDLFLNTDNLDALFSGPGDVSCHWLK
jgi:hypothetical protein